MSTYTQILYQFVFSTKNRNPVMAKQSREKLYKYLWGILHNNKCVIYAINGVDDHLHIITHIHPTIAVSNLVKDLKVASSIWIKEQNIFPGFTGWQTGYGAFTYSISAKKNLMEYVANQEQHHKKDSFLDEYKKLLSEHEIEFEEKYLL